MTGGQTDRVQVKTYLAAVSVLLRVAKAVFDRGMREPSGDHEDEALAHWFALRATAQTWLANQSTELCVKDREKFVGGLRFAHEMAHEDGGTVGRVESCPCYMAEQLRQLALLQVADVAGVVNAA